MKAEKVEQAGGTQGRPMRRLFYVALGATVGVLVVRRVSKAAAEVDAARAWPCRRVAWVTG